MLTEHGMSFADEDIFRQLLVIKLPDEDKEQVVRIIRQMEIIEGIKYVGPNYIGRLAMMSNDPMLDEQWGLIGSAGIKAPDTWAMTRDASNIRVGIIDTGIAIHPDLEANVD